MDIREIIQELAQDDQQEVYSLIGTVTDINEDERTATVTPINGGVDVFGARFSASLDNSNGVFVIPEEDTKVILTFINKNTGYITHVDQPKKVLIDSPEVIFNGGNNGGLINVNTLVAELNKNNALLEALKNILSGPPIPEAGNGAASSLQAALSAATAPLQVGSFTDITDNKITH